MKNHTKWSNHSSLGYRRWKILLDSESIFAALCGRNREIGLHAPILSLLFPYCTERAEGGGRVIYFSSQNIPRIFYECYLWIRYIYWRRKSTWWRRLRGRPHSTFLFLFYYPNLRNFRDLISIIRPFLPSASSIASERRRIKYTPHLSFHDSKELIGLSAAILGRRFRQPTLLHLALFRTLLAPLASNHAHLLL